MAAQDKSFFAGERMQVHRDGQSIQWYSRRAIDHREESGYNIMDAPLCAQTTAQRVILDGELVVWEQERVRPQRLSMDGVQGCLSYKFKK